MALDLRPTSRRFELRERTSRDHGALDAAVGGFDSLSDYGRYLRAAAAFRFAVESRIAAGCWPGAMGGWRPSAVAPLLRADLTDLGLVPGDPVDLGFAPAALEEFLGIGYVLEGSSLGANVLLRRAQAIGLGDGFGARHLAGLSGAAGNWRSFLLLLESLNSLDIEATAAAAAATFRAAGRAFGRPRSEP